MTPARISLLVASPWESGLSPESQKCGITSLVILSSSFRNHTVRGSYHFYDRLLDEQQIVSPRFLNQPRLRFGFNTFLKSRENKVGVVLYLSLRGGRLHRMGQAMFRSYLPLCFCFITLFRGNYADMGFQAKRRRDAIQV
jgi:hypothetical protein